MHDEALPLLVRLARYLSLKTLLLVALIAAPPAFAGELPLNAVYGTPEACQNFAAGGLEGVASGGDGGADEDPYMLVTPAQIIGFEWECSFNSNSLGSVSTTCWESGSADIGGVDISLKGDVLVLENPYSILPDRTVIYGDPHTELRPCPTDENAIM